jgi:small subunit ribosomal protein S17
MAKRLNGIVTKVSTQDTVIVEITRRVAHPLYKKLLTRTSRFKADTKDVQAGLGDEVIIAETRPLSKDKHFKVEKVVSTKGGAK